MFFDVERAGKIKGMVLTLEECDLEMLQELLAGVTKNPIA